MKTKPKQHSLATTSFSIWEERDRLHIHLMHADTYETIAEWWDDDARQMIEDGFFKRQPNLHRSVVDYCNEMGI